MLKSISSRPFMLQSLLRCGTTLRYNSNSTIPTFGSHCSYCGTSWGSDQDNTNSTRICHKCNQVTYANPMPVMVGLLYKKNPLKVLVTYSCGICVSLITTPR